MLSVYCRGYTAEARVQVGLYEGLGTISQAGLNEPGLYEFAAGMVALGGQGSSLWGV